MKKIYWLPLTQEQWTCVDEIDAHFGAHKWNASRVGKKFYAARRGEGHGPTKLLHREILNAPAGTEVDHVNGNSLDNRRINLRRATRLENSQNTAKLPGCSSRFKGVTWHKHREKWMAQIKINGGKRYLGYFSSEDAAAKAYDSVARVEFGEFARLNFL